MSNEELKAKVLALVSDAEIQEGGPFFTAIISHRKIHTLAKGLKEDPETAFDYLFNITGVDYPDQNQMVVVYHFESTAFHHTIAVKAIIPTRENPEIESLCDLWRTADFHEREVYDFFGIRFKNHPDMRRIFLDEISDDIGYPLRKDYVDEVNIIER